MASNVTHPPAQYGGGEGTSVNPEVIAELLAELEDGKATVAKVRDALVKLLHALS